MNKSWKDRQQDFLLMLLRPFVYIWMRLDMKRKVILDKRLSFRRKEPFILIANHTFLFDVIHVPLRFKNVPFIVGSQTLFSKQPTKFLVTQVAHVIKKSKGASDISTVKDILSAVIKGYPILIFPEGDTTFYGQTSFFEPSTFKLIKKLNIDVVTCLVEDGYLSKPRWAKNRRKNRQVTLKYDLLIEKENLKTLSVETIESLIVEKLNYNAFIDQKLKMIKHKGKKLAHGFEDVCYICPICEALHTFETKGNEITCKHCETTGYIDEYGFIEGLKYDNLVDFDQFQRRYQDKLLASKVSTQALFYFMEADQNKHTMIGKVTLSYKDHHFYIDGAYKNVIPLIEIKNATITLRRDFGFFYQDKHYMFKLDSYSAAFLRLAQSKY
jgi:hypothetical protein